jgi:hypothetical protein
MNENTLILKIRYFNAFILLIRQLNHLIVESIIISSNFLYKWGIFGKFSTKENQIPSKF